MIRSSGRVVRLTDIEKAVCEVFGLEPASLQSDAKGKRVSHPRMLAMWLARRHTRARAERDWPLFRPPQPQHGDLGPEASRWLDDLRPPARDGRTHLGCRGRHPASRAPLACGVMPQHASVPPHSQHADSVKNELLGATGSLSASVRALADKQPMVPDLSKQS